jgi:hypothetical protein
MYTLLIQRSQSPVIDQQKQKSEPKREPFRITVQPKPLQTALKFSDETHALPPKPKDERKAREGQNQNRDGQTQNRDGSAKERRTDNRTRQAAGDKRPQRQQKSQGETHTREERPQQTRDPKPQSDRPRRPQQDRKPQQKITVPDSEFDFESSNAKFAKDELPGQELEEVSTYTKSSFFDDISNDIKDREAAR